MCNITGKNPVLIMNISCACECTCPVLLPKEYEIRKLEEHKKIRVALVEAIDRKIAAIRYMKE